jgi:hypothetical protein
MAAVEKNGPAVPTTKPTFTVPCGKKAAKWWADPNPLTQNGPAEDRRLASPGRPSPTNLRRSP